MAHLDRISADQQARVASEIAQFIDAGLKEETLGEYAKETGEESPPVEAVEEVPPLSIGETLTVWRLKSAAFEALGKKELAGDLSKWVEPTRTWHHQIRLRGVAAGFARSSPEGESAEGGVFQISSSPIALQLSELFLVIERNPEEDEVVAEDPVVRILEVPPLQLTSLWLFSEIRQESRIVILQAGERYGEFRQGRMLNSEQFLGALIEGGPIVGVM